MSDDHFQAMNDAATALASAAPPTWSWLWPLAIAFVVGFLIASTISWCVTRGHDLTAIRYFFGWGLVAGGLAMVLITLAHRINIIDLAIPDAWLGHATWQPAWLWATGTLMVLRRGPLDAIPGEGDETLF